MLVKFDLYNYSFGHVVVCVCVRARARLCVCVGDSDDQLSVWFKRSFLMFLSHFIAHLSLCIWSMLKWSSVRCSSMLRSAIAELTRVLFEISGFKATV